MTPSTAMYLVSFERETTNILGFSGFVPEIDRSFGHEISIALILCPIYSKIVGHENSIASHLCLIRTEIISN